MKISTLIQKLEKAKTLYGDLDATVSETLWMYNTIQSVLYIKHPYTDSNDGCIEISDSLYEENEDYWHIL